MNRIEEKHRLSISRNILAMLVLLNLALLPLRAAAQPQPETPGRDRARAFLVLRIADALKLNEQDALKVGGIIRQSDEHRRALAQERQAIEQRLREALAKQPPDTVALSKLISEGNAIDQKLALVPEDSFRELQKVLTVEQQARLLLFRHELQGEIRRALQGRRQGAGRRMGGGAGGGPGAGK
jgi:Spy/CpxP family protein refolding chaperone